ncbi:2-deoxy-scyllo-inosose synthase [Solwaraspora sp. WMMA2080]|uniref:2-deoxy-scyllo-inosose synthase n=1 Tax=unclassified Solwaraspora TaxID=2627926 RepID=UPI00248AFE32|nr:MULTISPECIES: 2-deoxy-scyllo-inosose synthase [unclassified Solwaraspora]WBB97049.1 2-deoxy-scyllo-inosose synthase [Solwaraspora sp. WMMA2059]WBC19049.1 2-deoxy-scyllo-inosose synthase [Solwaraspora sp. WMMA2080]
MGTVRYPFRLGTDCLGTIVEDLVDMSASRLLIVCDSNTGPLFGAELVERLSPRVPANLLIHRAGEPYKDLQAVGTLAESALRLGADRACVVVAVGGGVIGNIAGLMAALLFRGIRLVHIPTSLIAMSDSVLSLKQAVNASAGKNLIGTFYPPECVLADTAMLRSLPLRETVSGLCEVVKNSLAVRPSMVEMLRASLRRDGNYDNETMYRIISESILAKASVSIDDMHECRAGLVLEYGHTVGHAIEYTAAGEISHGQAIGLGMLVAAEVSRRLGHLDDETVALHRELLARAGAAVTVPAQVDLDEVMHRLRFDNKRGYLSDLAESSAMVLLRGLGEPLWHDGRPLVPVPMKLIGEVIGELARPELPGFGLSMSTGAEKVPDAVGATDG